MFSIRKQMFLKIITGVYAYQSVECFPDSSVGKEYTCNARDLSLIPGFGRSLGEGKGYPLQYSGLENSMDCIVHGVTKSQIRLSKFHFHFHGGLLGNWQQIILEILAKSNWDHLTALTPQPQLRAAHPSEAPEPHTQVWAVTSLCQAPKCRVSFVPQAQEALLRNPLII